MGEVCVGRERLGDSRAPPPQTLCRKTRCYSLILPPKPCAVRPYATAGNWLILNFFPQPAPACYSQPQPAPDTLSIAACYSLLLTHSLSMAAGKCGLLQPAPDTLSIAACYSLLLTHSLSMAAGKYGRGALPTSSNTQAE